VTQPRLSLKELVREGTRADEAAWTEARAANEAKAAATAPPEAARAPVEAPQAPEKAPTEAPSGEKPAPEEPKLGPETKVEWERPDGQKLSATVGELQMAYDWALQNFESQKVAQDYIGKAEKVFEAVEQNPMGALLDVLAARKFGGDRDAAYAEVLRQSGAFLKEWHDLQQLPEGERKIREYEAALKDRDRKLQELEQERQSAAQAEEEFKVAQQIRGEILQAAAAEKLEVNARNLRMVGDVLLKTRQNGFNPSVQQVVRWVKGELAQRDTEGLKSAPIEEILKIRPELREHIIRQSVDETAANRSARVPTGQNGNTLKPGQSQGPRVYRDSPYELLNK
jgi:hypothetical protein